MFHKHQTVFTSFSYKMRENEPFFLLFTVDMLY